MTDHSKDERIAFRPMPDQEEDVSGYIDWVMPVRVAEVAPMDMAADFQFLYNEVRGLQVQLAANYHHDDDVSVSIGPISFTELGQDYRAVVIVWFDYTRFPVRKDNGGPGGGGGLRMSPQDFLEAARQQAAIEAALTGGIKTGWGPKH